MKEFRVYYSPNDGGGAKDQLGPKDLQVEIGTSLYTLSQEAQRYFYPVKLSDYQTAWLGLPSYANIYPEYDYNKSILFVSDPHFNASAQFRVFKGLEVLMRDNPALAKKTVFLAEGYPANQSVSVQSLIETDQNPSDELIKTVLDSFLINGYMAYEWKNHKEIPIIGIEDNSLYEVGRDFALLTNKNPKGIFFSGSMMELDQVLNSENPSLYSDFQRALRTPSFNGRVIALDESLSITLSDKLIWNITNGAAWSFFSIARNHEMARILIEKSKMYENPILFAGSAHLNSLGFGPTLFIFDIMKALITKMGPDGPFGMDIWQRIQKAENKGVYHFLKAEKIGFTFLDPVKLGDKEGDEVTYYKLFKAQQEAQKQNKSYEAYLSAVLHKTSGKQKTTVRPSPETAAELVKKLKEQEASKQESGVVFERKQEDEERPHWTKISREEVWGALVKDSIWEQPSTYQGRDYEQLRVANLGSNCPVIDDIVIDAQTATSMKILDLKAPSYQNVQAIESRVSGYIDKLSGFTEVDWNGNHFERGVDFQDRILEIGIPAGSATDQQIGKLVELQEYAQIKDVTLVINEVP